MTPLIEFTRLETVYGSFDFGCFNWGIHEEENILCLCKPWDDKGPLVRVQSACYTAEIFRSLDCDCHEQLDESLKRIGRDGGILIYMLCDGRGAGLLNKVRALELQRTKGMDTSDAYRALGLEQDPRTYDRLKVIFEHLGVRRLRLLTNNPRKLDGLKALGFDVVREPLEIPATPQSRDYLFAKANKMGHLFSQFALRAEQMREES
jgi:GTP cyclohydrolase II